MNYTKYSRARELEGEFSALGKPTHGRSEGHDLHVAFGPVVRPPDAPRDAVPPFKAGHRYTYEQTLMVRGGDHHFVECRTRGRLAR